MGVFVYILCAITSVVCAALLFRQARRAGGQLLFWSGWAFIALAAANILLPVDLVWVASVDFSILRNSLTLLGLGMLLYGLVWETN
jgi:hypothetical protein